MMTWRKVVATITDNVEEQFDFLKRRLTALANTDDPLMIVPYFGYGTDEALFVQGRVLENENVGQAQDDDSIWDNLLNTYRRFESDEVPYSRVQLRFENVSTEVVADEEGFFRAWIVPSSPLDPSVLWHQVELELRAPLREGQPLVAATAHVLVPPRNARFGVISDIDDTVVKSHVTQLLRMARLVFLGNAQTRLPFPGVAAFYRALQAGAQGEMQNPLFYVSSSPWNLYDLLVEFFRLQDIPLGPMFLRDWGVTREELLPTQHRNHKFAVIKGLLEYYPELPFILIGDSGQEDPEIYHEIVHEYPERILAVYIRDVSENPRDRAIELLAEEVLKAGSTLLLADDTMFMTKDAVDRGWVAPEMLDDLVREVEKDRSEPAAVEALLD